MINLKVYPDIRSISRMICILNKDKITMIISWILIVLFLYAAANKILELDKFKIQMGQSPMLTDFVEVLAWAVPGIEVVISILLFFPYMRLLGLFASFSLMVMFSAYIIAILNFSDYIPCACGGIFEGMQWTDHLLFNGITVLVAAVGVILQTIRLDTIK